MGSLTLQYPPMTGGSAEQQLSLLRGYLIQLTDELNGADWSANAVFQEVSQAIDAQSLPAEEQRTQLAGWSSLKELIIKTADYAAKNSQTLQYQLSGSYVAKSDFGLFEEAMLTRIEATEAGITQNYEYVGQVKTEIEADVDQSISNLSTSLGSQYSALDEYVKGIEGELNTVDTSVQSLDAYAKGLADSLSTTNSTVSGLSSSLDKTDGEVDALKDETAGVNNTRAEGLDKDEEGQTITVKSKQYVKTGLLYYDGLLPVYGVGVGNVRTTLDVDGHVIVDKGNLLLTLTPDCISFWEKGKQIAYIEKEKMHFPSATLEAYDAKLTGTITAAAGSSFGPWTVTESSIYRAESETENKLGGNGLYFGTSGLSIKDAFQVDANGKLTATGATVTGTIKANDLLLGSTDASGTTEYSSIKTQLKTLVDSVNELSVLAEAVAVTGEGQSASASGFNFWADGIGGLQITTASSGSYAVELSSAQALRIKGGSGDLHIQNSGNTCFVALQSDGNVKMKGTKLYWNGTEVNLGATTATAVFG